MILWLFLVLVAVFFIVLLNVDWEKDNGDLAEFWMLEDDAEEAFNDEDDEFFEDYMIWELTDEDEEFDEDF